MFCQWTLWTSRWYIIFIHVTRSHVCLRLMMQAIARCDALLIHRSYSWIFCVTCSYLTCAPWALIPDIWNFPSRKFLWSALCKNPADGCDHPVCHQPPCSPCSKSLESIQNDCWAHWIIFTTEQLQAEWLFALLKRRIFFVCLFFKLCFVREYGASASANGKFTRNFKVAFRCRCSVFFVPLPLDGRMQVESKSSSSSHGGLQKMPSVNSTQTH